MLWVGERGHSWRRRASLRWLRGKRAGPAQTTPPNSQEAASGETEGVRKFEPSFFARYSPVTAYDMVRQLPGFSIDNGDALRGFGATAGNVLIDGQRPSSKNAISDELTRISARDVARIELIGAAAAGDIDVRGYTELANVVLKPATGSCRTPPPGAATCSGRASASARASAARGSGRPRTSASASTSRAPTRASARKRKSRPRCARRAHLHTNEFSQQVVRRTADQRLASTGRRPRRTRSTSPAVLMPRPSRTRPASCALPRPARSPQSRPTTIPRRISCYVDLGGDWEHKFSPETR